jgi:hypothetical protein
VGKPLGVGPAGAVKSSRDSHLRYCTKSPKKQTGLTSIIRQQITEVAHALASGLFPILQGELGEPTEPAKRLAANLETPPCPLRSPSRGWIGRPYKDNIAIASAFVAKTACGSSARSSLRPSYAPPRPTIPAQGRSLRRT